MESIQNKFALLRDLCKATGVQIHFPAGKQFVLDNDTVLMKQCISRIVWSKRAAQTEQKGGKGKGAKQQAQHAEALPDEEIFVYENLPFQPSDIGDFNPILKHLDISNRDAVMLMNQAREAQAGGHLEAAFDFYS